MPDFVPTAIWGVRVYSSVAKFDFKGCSTGSAGLQKLSKVSKACTMQRIQGIVQSEKQEEVWKHLRYALDRMEVRPEGSNSLLQLDSCFSTPKLIIL